MTPEDLIHDYESAANSHDLDQTLSLIDADAVYWFSDGTSHAGKPAVEAAIRRNFEAIKAESYRISELVWIGKTKDLAVCLFRFDWSGQIEGQAASGFGRGTSVVARRAGCWIVIHEHLSKGTHSANLIA